MHEVGIESKNCAQFEDVIKIITTDPQLKQLGWRHYNEKNHNERHYYNEKQLKRNAITTKKLVPFVVVDKGTSLLAFGIFSL